MQILKESIRRQIITEARREFADNGYDGSSMKSMASRSGVSIGTVYKYFGSKERLFDVITMAATEAVTGLSECSDPATFYSIVNGCRTELRILLFRGRNTSSHAASRSGWQGGSLGGKIRAIWFRQLLEALLMHKPTRVEALQLISEYIHWANALKTSGYTTLSTI